MWAGSWATYCSPAVCGLVTHGLQRLRLAMNTLIKGTAFYGRDSNMTPHPEYKVEKLRLGPSCRNVCLLYSLYSKRNCCRVCEIQKALISKTVTQTFCSVHNYVPQSLNQCCLCPLVFRISKFLAAILFDALGFRSAHRKASAYKRQYETSKQAMHV